jgi:hypothetical protein
VPSSAGVSTKLCSPLMMPGRLDVHRSSAPSSATVILGLMVITRPLAGWTVRSVILLPTATSPNASGKSGFHSGYRPRSVRTAHTAVGGASIWMVADMVFIPATLSRPGPEKTSCSPGLQDSTVVGVIDSAGLLAAYDSQLRTDAETPGALSVTRQGPLRLVTFDGGRGFITYRDLDGAEADAIERMVDQALAYFQANPEITKVEWKTRGHDRAPGLHETLLEHGFTPDEPESIMVGDAQALAADVADVALPDGVALRQVTEEADVRAMIGMQDEVFGNPHGDEMVDGLLRRLARGDEIELWVAEAAGTIVSAGRIEPVPGTDFAGIWGGATRPEWRGRGIYRALTAERARSALRMGKKYINSDSTEFSRPILERSGLVKVSTTTPYNWQR